MASGVSKRDKAGVLFQELPLRADNENMIYRTLYRIIFFAAFSLVLGTNDARAQFGGAYDGVLKKQEQKKQSRWTLAEWMEMKDRNRWMDLWLAQNSHSSLYEFFLEAKAINYVQYESSAPSNTTNHNSYGGSLGAYAGIVGLRGSYESASSENLSSWTGSLNLRLFGRALQDTHINLEYGLKGLASSGPTSESFQNQFGGVSLNVYLLRNFGLEGSYQKVLPTQSDRRRTLQGEASQAGIFIDFGLLRIFGSWRKEFRQYDGADLPDLNEFREGLGGGLRLYF